MRCFTGCFRDDPAIVRNRTLFTLGQVEGALQAEILTCRRKVFWFFACFRAPDGPQMDPGWTPDEPRTGPGRAPEPEEPKTVRFPRFFRLSGGLQSRLETRLETRCRTSGR